MQRSLLAVLLSAAAVLTTAPGPAVAAAESRFAPVNRPGPALSVPTAELDASLACTGNVAKGRQTVLFVPGTTVNPREDYSWNWFRALDQLNRPYCAVTLPFNTTGDTQVASEYVVHAIRKISAITERKVQVMGHSQGGTEPRFALRFWPDLRSKVDDYIAFAATNHGSALIRGLCLPTCSPSLWQQIDNSNYIQAMNSHQETFEGISYTAIYTWFDQFVQPNLDDTGTTSLSGPGDITNVALQDVCPANTGEHIAIGTYDPVAYALAMDALNHPGPADPSRIPSSVCNEVLMPGVDPRTFATNLADAYNQIFAGLTTDPRVDQEPELKPYTLAGRS
ncbi:esterase/lipase family protein [Sporichthya polymorpha]|uniref:esterase/lipase family protein n=1 Tax=Sporichthya polymorpha TaxID=35751 RepID=UPI0003691098|nr:hypothetical protein [Sporichthya polymorpha]